MTKAFFKIEADCNTNLPSAFENGCNHLYGNSSLPAVCLHGLNAPSPWNPNSSGLHSIDCVLSFGTYPIPGV